MGGSLPPAAARAQPATRRPPARTAGAEDLEPVAALGDGPEPLEVGRARRVVLGIEPLVWLTDVGGLSRKEAVDLMRASARTLLAEALRSA